MNPHNIIFLKHEIIIIMCFYGKIVFERVATTVNSNSIVINLKQNKQAAGLYIVYVKTKLRPAVL